MVNTNQDFFSAADVVNYKYKAILPGTILFASPIPMLASKRHELNFINFPFHIKLYYHDTLISS